MKTLYLECNMGAASDMLLGALYEICDQKDLFLTTMNEVFGSYHISLTADKSEKCGIIGTHMGVLIDGHEESSSHEAAATTHSLSLHERIRHAAPGYSETETDSLPAENQTAPHHSNYATILAQLNALSLPEQVKKDTAAIYQLLGEAEAKVHGSTLDEIPFHAPGNIDSIATVAGCALLIYLIAPEQILASPIHVGTGFVHASNGVLPVPSPTTAELLKGIPYYSGTITGELCTPTGAAILKYYATRFFPMPAMAPTAIGYGMGKKNFEIANCVRAFLGETFEAENPKWKDYSTAAPAADNADASPSADTSADTDNADANGTAVADETVTTKTAQTTGTVTADNDTAVDTEASLDDDTWDGSPYEDTVLAISCNIDDMTGEAMSLATEIMMAAGALDVYTIPIQMKKNRPGILLTCICNPQDRDKFTGLFFLHTSTRGVRYQEFGRSKLESTVETRSTAYGDIRIKKSTGYGIEKEKPDFEDLKSVILKNGCALSLADVTKSLLE